MQGHIAKIQAGIKLKTSRFSCGFRQGFGLLGNTFVGNCLLRILETAWNFPAKISLGKVKNMQRKPLVKVVEVSLHGIVSCKHTAANSAVNAAGDSAAKLFFPGKSPGN